MSCFLSGQLTSVSWLMFWCPVMVCAQSQGLAAAVGRARWANRQLRAQPALLRKSKAEPGLQQQFVPSKRYKLKPLTCLWCFKGREERGRCGACAKELVFMVLLYSVVVGRALCTDGGVGPSQRDGCRQPLQGEQHRGLLHSTTVSPPARTYLLSCFVDTKYLFDL